MKRKSELLKGMVSQNYIELAILHGAGFVQIPLFACQLDFSLYLKVNI